MEHIQFHLTYFNSTILDGIMSSSPEFYQAEMTEEEIKRAFLERRIRLGEQYGFSGFHILTPIQKEKPILEGKTEEEQQSLLEQYHSIYPDGYSIRITEEMIEGYQDLTEFNLFADILMIGQDLPKIALACPVADSPVLFVEDTKHKVVAMAPCGGEAIDRGLPFQMIDAIRKETDAKVDDLTVLVSPYAHKENFTHTGIHKWVDDFSIWRGAVENQFGYFHVDMELAIRSQLMKQGMDPSHVHFSELDTITDPCFYSDHEAEHLKEKAGRFYSGCFYSKEKRK